MESVVVGNPIIREADFHLDGVLADPDNPRITIRDANGIALVTNGIPTRLSTGIWQYVYDVPLSLAAGINTDTWTYSFNGVAGAPVNDFWKSLAVGTVTFPTPGYTYDLTTDIGRLRLLVQDNDLSSVDVGTPLEQRSAAFSDGELAALLALEPDLLEAAALTLRAWAANKQLIVVARKFARGEIDYGQIRADLMKLADAYHERAIGRPADALVEQTWTDFGADRIIFNEWQRGL